MKTKRIIFFFFGLIAVFLFSGHKPIQTDYKTFELSFITVGHGSNFRKMEPVFYVKGLKFTYTSEQTTYWKNEKINKPIIIQTGELRKSSVDSIIKITKNIKDSVIDIVNPGISSGETDYITIKTQTKKIQFNLQNSSTPTAKKIVSILNTYIKDKDNHLGLFSDPINIIDFGKGK